MSSIPGYQRIPSLEALALQAYISAPPPHPEPMEAEGERLLNSVSSLALFHWERLKKHAPRGPLGIQKAIRTIEKDPRNSELFASKTSSADRTIGPSFSRSQRPPKGCKVTELFQQFIKQLNEELQKNDRTPQEKVLVAPEQFEFIQASLQREAEQWVLKSLYNEIRRIQQLSEATDEEFQDWLANLTNETPMLDISRLNLQHPKTQALPDEIRHFQRLQHLSLGTDYTAVQSLRYLPESICELTNLTHLDVSYNELEELPQSFHHLVNLQDLRLYGNELELLSESFGDLTSLTNLDLQNNRLKKLPESFGKLVHLDMLDLSSNDLEQLPQSFGNLENLVGVDLSSNELESLPFTFRNLSELENLNLSSNKFKKFPQEISFLNQLEYLDLSDNELKQLSEAFGNLHNLTELDLSSNKLRQLPSTFDQLTSLQSLHLESNKLSKFPTSISSMNFLEAIFLSDNSITMLPLEPEELENLAYEYPEYFEIFEFKGNPLLLISDTHLNKTHSLSELAILQSQNFHSYKPLTNLSSLLLALAREDHPAIGALFNTLNPGLKNRVLSRYQTLAALETQELNHSSSSSSSSSASTSQGTNLIHPFKYLNLFAQAYREEICDLIKKISPEAKAVLIPEIRQLAANEKAPLEELAAEAFDTNLLRLVDAMALISQDFKRKAANSNPPSGPLEIKRLKKEE